MEPTAPAPGRLRPQVRRLAEELRVRVEPAPLALAVAAPVLLGLAYAVGGTYGGIGLVIVPLLLVVALRSHGDAVSHLTIMLVVLCVVPERLRVGPLGSAGTPAALIGLLAFGGWASARLSGRWQPGGPGPGRPAQRAVVVFLVTVLISYVAAHFRALDLLETKAADRGVLTIASAVGVTLYAADGIASAARLRVLLKRVALGTTGIAALGVFQFLTHVDLAARIRVPGLVSSSDSFSGERSGFQRVAATTAHPIEFSVVLAIGLPLALHFAMTARAGTRARWWWAAVGLLGAGLPMAVSRTAALGAAAVAVVLLPGWSWRQRGRAVVVTAVFLAGMKVAVPGLIGTLRALFTSSGNDPSVTSRQADITMVWNQVYARPVFGRGIGTFVPTRYQYVDNAYLLGLVETGVVGLLGFATVLAAALRVGRLLRRWADDPDTRALGHHLTAAAAVVVVCSATYDFLSFATGRTLFFLLLGISGAAWRLHGRLPDRDLDDELARLPAPEPVG